MATRGQRHPTAAAVIERMRADHRAVIKRTDAMLANADTIAGAGRGGSAARTALRATVAHLARQFATHMRAEDEVIYPAVEGALPSSRERLQPLAAEHEELRSMLVDLRDALQRPRTPARDEQIEVAVRDLVDLLRIHIRKEEAVVFTVAARLLPPERLQALAARLRHRMPGSPRGREAGTRTPARGTGGPTRSTRARTTSRAPRARTQSRRRIR